MDTAERIGVHPSEARALAAWLETARAEDIVGWAVDRFAGDLVLASSFQDCVLVDLATQVDPGIEVVFLDTGFHFAETLEYVEQVRRRYDLRLHVVRPDVSAGEWPCGTRQCCQARKVEPLQRMLGGKRAWMSGVRRSETPERAQAPIVSWRPDDGLCKVNPIATWSDDDVRRYAAARHLPEHPLVRRGYPSIGCAPTTVPVESGAPVRSGRWPGSGRTECGLHL